MTLCKLCLAVAIVAGWCERVHAQTSPTFPLTFRPATANTAADSTATTAATHTPQALATVPSNISFDDFRAVPPAQLDAALMPIPTVDSPINFDRWRQPTDSAGDSLPLHSAALTQPWWTINQQAPVVPQAAVSQAPGSQAPGSQAPGSQAPGSQATGSGWELEQLIWLAVKHSPLVQAVLIEPQILQAQAAATNGQFDPNAFVESIFRDTSDPVGNTLTTGSASRLNDHSWTNSSGLRARNTQGGQAELAQDFNFKDSNSDFFVPGDQADTRMVLRYTQPLMRGAGVTYNRSSFVVASFAADESLLDASKKVQEHAFAITTSYWELVAARASYLQISNGLIALQELHEQLCGRSDIDTLKSQQLRAESAIYKKRADQAKSLAHLLTAQANLRAAVAAPELIDAAGEELVPLTRPADWKGHMTREAELTSALNYHPEIQAIRFSLQGARTKLQVAENDLRPTLNLVLEGYVRGLNGDYDAARSFGDQFSTGAPSYSGGVTYLRPYRNTAAKAILRERRLELRRTLLELDHTLLAVGASVEGSLAQLDASFSELESSVRSTLAVKAELDYLTARWQDAFLDGTARNLLLDQLLNAQIQLIQSENAWARAQADHMIAGARVRLATGELLPVQR